MNLDQSFLIRVDGALTALASRQHLQARRLSSVEPIDPQRRGRAHAGQYWSSTMGRHVAFGNAAERRLLLWLDWREDIVWIVHRPVGADVPVPPFVVVGSDETVAFIAECGDDAFFNRTRQLEQLTGWPTSSSPTMSPAFWNNLKFLSQFRRPNPEEVLFSDPLKLEFANAQPLRVVDDMAGGAADLRSVLFQLLWNHELVTDLNQALCDSSIVSLPSVVAA